MRFDTIYFFQFFDLLKTVICAVFRLLKYSIYHKNPFYVFIITGHPCEDKTRVNCTLFVASNICNVPSAKIYCAKTCKLCSPVHVVN